MVKIFVGNLAHTVDGQKLRTLFEQFATVTELDVLKTYAFVHVATQEDAQRVFKELNNFELDGRQIHLEESTSRLRRQPGMADVCFRCGSADHKTPNCPTDRADETAIDQRRKAQVQQQQRQEFSVMPAGPGPSRPRMPYPMQPGARLMSPMAQYSPQTIQPMRQDSFGQQTMVSPIRFTLDRIDPLFQFPFQLLENDRELALHYQEYMKARQVYAVQRDHMERMLIARNIYPQTHSTTWSPMQQSPASRPGPGLYTRPPSHYNIMEMQQILSPQQGTPLQQGTHTPLPGMSSTTPMQYQFAQASSSPAIQSLASQMVQMQFPQQIYDPNVYGTPPSWPSTSLAQGQAVYSIQPQEIQGISAPSHIDPALVQQLQVDPSALTQLMQRMHIEQQAIAQQAQYHQGEQTSEQLPQQRESGESSHNQASNTQSQHSSARSSQQSSH